jgi:hypothetical protein
MAVLLTGTTIGGNAAIHTGNLSTHGILTTSGGTITSDLVIGTAASGALTQAFGSFAQLKFDNSHSDINRGPNKIVMHDNATAWVGGFGIHDDTVAYYSGGTHKWYKTTSQTASTQVMSLDASGNLTVSGTITAPLSGNATTATTLQTARTIGGVSFNGSANINLPGVNAAGNQSTTGNASTATTFSTTSVNYKGVTDGAVAGQLMWKNYGNQHTIFDASNSTSPSGSAVSNANSTVAWAATYPTLMGWNGTQTYGVRVDSARVADILVTARTLTIGNTGKTFNGSANVTWSWDEIGFPKYVGSRGQNLLTNGAALLGNNYNFSSFTFDGSQAYYSNGSFRFAGSATVFTQEFMPVNPELRYKLEMFARTLNGVGRYYSMIGCYDADNLDIQANHHMYQANTLTTLAQALNNGDTIVYLTSAANWVNTGTAGVNTHLRSFIFWDYINSFGYLYPSNTYSRNWVGNAWDPGNVNFSNNTITLRVPWAGGNKPAGTKLSNGSSGGTYKYVALVNTLIPQTFTYYSGIMSGVDLTGTNAGDKFPPGTASARIGWLMQYQTPSETAWFANLAFGVDQEFQAEKWKTARTLTIGSTGKSVDGTGNVSWTLAEMGAYAATNPSGFITSSGSISGNSASATVLQTARTLTIGSTGKTFNGSANVAWTLAEIGAQAAGSYVIANGTSAGDIDADWGQSFKTFDPVPSGTPPLASPNIRTINVGENFARRTQLAFNYASDQAWFRRRQDSIWSAWREFVHSGNFTTWAQEKENQRLSTTSDVTHNSTTSPLFLVNSHSDNTKGYRIHNTSGASVSAMFTNSSNQLVIAAGAVDQINLNKNVLVNAVALGVNIAPSATAGRIDASNDIVAFSSSDERLKDNITPIENALDKVKSLTGVEFDWKPEHKEAHGHEGRDTGIIAQQVLAVMPTAVRTNDTGYLAVRYEKLIGLLIEANKELAARVEELEKKIG